MITAMQLKHRSDLTAHKRDQDMSELLSNAQQGATWKAYELSPRLQS